MRTSPRRCAARSPAVTATFVLGMLGIAACGGSDTSPATPAAITKAPAMSAPAATAAVPNDEDLPRTHVDRLKDRATRLTAVERLVELFAEAMRRDEGNREGPAVKPLLAEIVKPMNEACLSRDLDDYTRSKIISFMSAARHPDGERCLVKALEDYKVELTEEDVRWAARAVTAMKLDAAAGPLLSVFLKMRPSRPMAAAVYRDVYDAMVRLEHPSWEPQLIRLLERPLSDPQDRVALIDEVQWWTVTAAKILGDMRSEKAIPGMLQILLTPGKADAQSTTILGLVKIGKPAAAATIALLEGRDKHLVDYAKAEARRSFGENPTNAQKGQAAAAHVMTAALILGTIGREEAVSPLLAALRRADDVPRAVIARELTKLPKKPEIVKAFQTAFEKTGVSVTIPPGEGAREALLEAVGRFYDASLVPWLVKQAERMKGDAADVVAIRESTLSACAKLMQADQIKIVDKLYDAKPSSDALKQMTVNLEEDLASANKRLASADDDKKRESIRKEIAALNELKKGPLTVGSGMAKEYRLAKDLLAACGSDVDCYLAKASDPASQEEESLFQGIKALYMIGEYGTPDVRQKLLDAMPKLRHAALRFLAVSLIDYFSPGGDTVIAQRLQAIVDEAEAKKDFVMMVGNAPFRTVIYRLSARTQ